MKSHEKDVEEITNHEYLKCDPSNRRWPKSEVQSLITVRAALDHKFLNGHKSSVWEEVAIGLSKMGYSRTAKKCKENGIISISTIREQWRVERSILNIVNHALIFMNWTFYMNVDPLLPEMPPTI